MKESDRAFKDWLDCRFPVDSRSRATVLQDYFVEKVASGKEVHIVDVGSGRGSSILHFCPIISEDQTWYLLEKEDELVEEGIKSLHRYFEECGSVISSSDKTITAKVNDKQITIRYFNTFLGSLDSLDIPKSKVDVLTAHAVLDILEPDQLEKLLRTCSVNNWLFYAPMNYVGMAFYPEKQAERTFVGLYEEHMTRTGRLGKNVCHFTKEIASNLGGSFSKGRSNWVLNEKDEDVNRYLITFIYDALLEMDVDKSLLLDWKKEKTEQISKGEITICVDHLDILIQFNPSGK